MQVLQTVLLEQGVHARAIQTEFPSQVRVAALGFQRLAAYDLRFALRRLHTVDNSVQFWSIGCFSLGLEDRFNRRSP